MTEVNEYPEQQQMNEEFENTFYIDKEFPTLAAAKTEAFNFGRNYNVPFVVKRSDPTRGNMILTCQHFGLPRSMRADKASNEETETSVTEKQYHRDSQKLSCKCFIKFKKSRNGVCVSDLHVQHGHPIPKSSTTYHVYRKQDSENKALIIKILSLSTSNAAEAIMTVSDIRI